MEASARLTPLRVFPTPDALGDALAGRVLDRIERARLAGKRFLLGCPTGRTPRPIYAAMARRLAEHPRDLDHLIFVMMDEYLVQGASGFVYAGTNSCHEYVERHISVLGGSVWFPDPEDPAAYDGQVADAGGIDFFILASGASDGHVAFNPPGAPRASRTRVVRLSEETRRDNLETFPAFGTLENVPRYGVSVGVATIASAREAVMVVWGASKRLTLSRIRAVDRYDPSWPATVIHECTAREIVCDAEAGQDQIRQVTATS